MTDTVAFLNAVHDADEQAARAAGGHEWSALCPHGDGPFPPSHDLCARVDGPDITIYDEGGHTAAHAAHIARHDPQSVLARVEAERALVAMHTGLHICVSDWSTNHSYTYTDEGKGFERKLPCPTLRTLAWGYRGREGWRAEWAPSVLNMVDNPAMIRTRGFPDGPWDDAISVRMGRREEQS